MNKLLASTLILNGALAALVVFLYFGTGQKPGSIKVTPIQEGREVRPAERQAMTPTATRFHWNQVESTELPALISNLKSIGCPDSTLRDIVLARVHRNAVARLPETLSRTDLDWNPPIPAGHSQKRIRHPLKDPEPARAAEMVKLLGENWNKDARFMPREDKLLLNFLATETAVEVWKLADGAPWQRIAANPSPAIKRLLNDSQLEELRLRVCDTALDMRENLAGVEPSEEQFRGIVRLRDMARNSGNPQDAARAESDMRVLLGAQGVEQLHRAEDMMFKALYIFARHYGQPLQSAANAYDALREGQARADRIRRSNTLEDVAKARALVENREQISNAVLAAMGPRAQGALLWCATSWLDRLEKLADTSSK